MSRYLELIPDCTESHFCVNEKGIGNKLNVAKANLSIKWNLINRKIIFEDL
jgi:hypothetical protein